MGACKMTERKLLTLDDFVKQPTTYTRFGEKVTRNPIEQIYNAGLLKDYKQLSISHKYIKFTGMMEEGDGGEGWYIRDESITDEEDIGVIIYIGQHKYRRLYGAYVLIDWFYTGDFGIALQRARKYASVRCIPGKVYECNSEITLKLDIRSATGRHGLIDYGHVLIDLRGATINYNVEGSSYCFNIRIYNRETKFMLTNGIFNVSEESKVFLKNIANVVGGNNYTDMLTDMHYNVDKELLPDTNRVVLFSNPVVEGAKTFSKTFNYVGNDLSAGDSQAVTKEYMPVNIDEDSVIAINDKRILNNVVFNSNFITGGNVATNSNVDNIIAKVSSYLVNIAKTMYNNIFRPGMYYTAINSSYDYLSYPLLEYIKEPDYTVNIVSNAEYIFMPDSLEFDEQFIGLPIYNKVRCNKSIVVSKNSLSTELCYSSIELRERCKVPQSVLVDYTYYGPPLLFTGSSVKYHIYDTSIIENKELAWIGWEGYASTTFIFKTTDNNFYGFSNVNTQLGYTFMDYSVGSRYILPFTFDFAGLYNIGMQYPEYAELYANNKLLVPIIIGAELVAIIEIVNPTTASFYSEGATRAGYLLQRADTPYSLAIPIKPLDKYTITVSPNVVKVTSDNIAVSANILLGSEYISLLDNASIYIKDYEEEGDIVSFKTFYVKAIVPVQANLAIYTSIDNIATTSKYNLQIIYNNEQYISAAGSIYIPRFKIDYPYLQSKALASVSKKNIKDYNEGILFTNPLLNPIIYSREYLTHFNFNIEIIPTYGTHYNNRQDERDGSGCQCYRRSTGISAKFMDTYLYVEVAADGSNVYCAKARDRNTIREYVVFSDYSTNSSLIVNYGESIAEYALRLYSVNAVGCYNCSTIKYEDTAIKSYYLESRVPKCGGCGKHDCPPVLSGSGIPACWFYCFNLYSSKSNMFNSIFGTDAWLRWVYRDGNLKNPYKDRSSRPEYTRIAPVLPYVRSD